MFVEVYVSLCFVNATQTVVVFSCVCTKPQSIHFERDKKLIYLKVVFTVLKKHIFVVKICLISFFVSLQWREEEETRLTTGLLHFQKSSPTAA